MRKPLRVAASPLTGTIYCGHVLKDGMTWAANKQDVTVDALVAVAMHAEQFGKPVIITANGEPEYEITVKNLRKDREAS
ncbi:hypothetical protein H0A73_17270 [Alcaligenaceae bacterium]|nr:hypothetical protein [Alcaligenaceae bacterium]